MSIGVILEALLCWYLLGQLILPWGNAKDHCADPRRQEVFSLEWRSVTLIPNNSKKKLKPESVLSRGIQHTKELFSCSVSRDFQQNCGLPGENVWFLTALVIRKSEGHFNAHIVKTEKKSSSFKQDLAPSEQKPLCFVKGCQCSEREPPLVY